MAEEKNKEEWSRYSCPNKGCRDYGVTGKGNVRLERYYGRNEVALLRCRTRMKTFSENRYSVLPAQAPL